MTPIPFRSILAFTLCTACPLAVWAAQSGATHAPADQRIAALKKSADDSSLSDADHVRALANLAAAQVDAANDRAEQLADLQLNISRLTWQLRDLAAQIATNTSLVHASQQLQPTAALEDIKQKIAQATGGPDNAVWFTHDNVPLPTLSAVRQQISTLDGQITAIQQDIKRIGDQRATLLDQARTLADQSEQQSGQQAVDSYTQASNLRKQAANVGVQIDQLQAKLRPLQDQLAIAQDQQNIVTSAIQTYTDQQRQIEDGWKQAAAQAEAMTQIARQVVDGNGSTEPQSDQPSAGSPDPASVRGKLQRLAELVQTRKTTLDAALADLAAAAQRYDAAAKAADNLARTLSQRSDLSAAHKAASAEMRQALEPQSFRLSQAGAQHQIALFDSQFADDLAERLAMVQSLQTALQQAGIAAPSELPSADELSSELQAARSSADAAYKQADELMGNLTSGSGSQAVRNAALIARALNQYGWYELRHSAGESDADLHLSAAMDHARQAMDQHLILPPLPGKLGEMQATELAQVAQAATRPSTPAARGAAAGAAQPAAAPGGRQGAAPARPGTARQPTAPARQGAAGAPGARTAPGRSLRGGAMRPRPGLQPGAPAGGGGSSEAAPGPGGRRPPSDDE